MDPHSIHALTLRTVSQPANSASRSFSDQSGQHSACGVGHAGVTGLEGIRRGHRQIVSGKYLCQQTDAFLTTPLHSSPFSYISDPKELGGEGRDFLANM